MLKSHILKEWNKAQAKEQRFINKKAADSTNAPYSGLDKYVPENLQATLNNAFTKAFKIVFQKGDALIDKVVSGEQRSNDYKINEYSADVQKSRKSIRAFSKKAGVTSTKNILISGAEGVGLGILGIGLPDIPVFVGVILKSIYEVSMDFGFEHTSEQERLFMLKIIEASLEKSEKFINLDNEINSIIEMREIAVSDDLLCEQMKNTTDCLSRELLYAKFIQGIPFAGIIGGLSNVSCLKKITKYATMKYNRRFLYNKR